MKESHDMLYKMAVVGYFTTFKKSGKQESPKFKVFVCDDDFTIPHMHIWDDETDGKKMHTCVCLNQIEYFLHTGKEDILTPKQKKYLVAFLKEECKNKRYKTNWEYALSMWNDNNTDKTQVDETSEVLDYTKLNEQNMTTMEHSNRNIDSVKYDGLYKSCSPNHFKEIKYFSPDGKSMPNGHSLQRGGFLQACRRNSNNFVLTEAVHGKQYGSSKYKGGVIVFSTTVNAAELDEVAIHEKVEMVIANFQQRYFAGNKLCGIINKLKQYFKKKSMSDETIAYSVGNAFKGKYIGNHREEYNEHSMAIEVNGLSTKALLCLGEMIARAFHQETVLLKDLNKDKIYYANGLRVNKSQQL